MGFSVKIAPGLRVRASSRGIRTSVGPRVARVHVGAGRPGISTGVGPVGFYTGLGGSARPARRPPRPTPTGATSTRQPSAEKVAEAQRISDQLLVISTIHRASFDTAVPPQAPPPPPISDSEAKRRHRSMARQHVPFWPRAQRRAALQQADAWAAQEVADRRKVGADQQRAYQLLLATWWDQLLGCDPDVVLPTLNRAFSDNEAPARAVAVADGRAVIVVEVPGAEVVPERRATTTAAGNLSLKKLTKTEVMRLHKQVVLGSVLATIREAFAVAPGLASVRVVAVRSAGTSPEALVAASCQHTSIDAYDWNHLDARQVFGLTCTDVVMVEKGVTKELRPITQCLDPDLRAALASH